MQLVLDTKGLKLTKKNNIFHVSDGKRERNISPQKLKSIAVTASVELSSDAIVLAINNEVPILFFDRIGKAKARLWSPYFESIASLRRNQVRFGDSPEATAWMISMFELKTQAQLENLRFLRKQKGIAGGGLNQAISSIKIHNHKFESLRGKLLEEVRNNMMGIEGTIARIYWQALGGALPRPYRFKERSRRPAKDIFNAALNYNYGMLYSIIEGSLFAAGLDPYLGLLHADNYRKPTLSFDMIEPFRPWIDRLLIDICVSKEMERNFITKNQFGIFFNKQGKAFIIPKFNEFLRNQRDYLGQESTVKNHIYSLSGRLAQRIRSVME